MWGAGRQRKPDHSKSAKGWTQEARRPRHCSKMTDKRASLNKIMRTCDADPGNGISEEEFSQYDALDTVGRQATFSI